MGFAHAWNMALSTCDLFIPVKSTIPYEGAPHAVLLHVDLHPTEAQVALIWAARPGRGVGTGVGTGLQVGQLSP